MNTENKTEETKEVETDIETNIEDKKMSLGEKIKIILCLILAYALPSIGVSLLLNTIFHIKTIIGGVIGFAIMVIITFVFKLYEPHDL